MYPTVQEETTTTSRAANATGAYLNARERDQVASVKHRNVFESDEHLDRLVEVCDRLKAFFGSNPSYITRRGLGSRKPFEAVKMADVGRYLSKIPQSVKQNFYKSLFDMGGIEITGKNGHLIVRIFA